MTDFILTGESTSHYKCPRVDPEWMRGRETSDCIASAIHAISSDERSADDIWESPTDDENAHVLAATREYLNNNYFPIHEDGMYFWGVETLRVHSPVDEDLEARIIEAAKQRRADLLANANLRDEHGMALTKKITGV